MSVIDVDKKVRLSCGAKITWILTSVRALDSGLPDE
jgi:hypothetical protein